MTTSKVEAALVGLTSRLVRPSELSLEAIVAGVPAARTRPGAGAGAGAGVAVDVVWPPENSPRV